MMDADNGIGIDCADEGDKSIEALELLNNMSNHDENKKNDDVHIVQGEKALAEAINYFDKGMNELDMDLASDDASEEESSFIPHNTKFAILVRNALGIYRQFYDPLPPTYPRFEQFADKLKSHIAQQFYDKNEEKKGLPNHSSTKATLAGSASFLAGALGAMGLGGLSLIGVETLMGVLLGGFGVASLFKIGLNIYETKKLQKTIIKELGMPMLCSEHFPALLICALDEENVLRPLYNAADGEAAKQLLKEIFNQWIEEGCKYEEMQKKDAEEKTSKSKPFWEKIFDPSFREKMQKEKFDIEGEDDDDTEMGDEIDEKPDENGEYENGMMGYPQ